MKHHAPIIAAVDLSASTPHLLAHGAKLASASGCPLIAAHVIHDHHLGDWMKATGRKASAAHRIEEVTPLLSKLVNDCCADANTETDIRVGRPRKALYQLVAEKQAGLLIVSAHNPPNRSLGPVARHCARSAPSSVLVLRDRQGGFFKKIAVCVDLQNPSITGLEHAIDFSHIYQASLEIIHVIYPPNLDPWGKAMEQPMDSRIPYADMVRTRARKQLDDYLAPFSDKLDGIEWSPLILESQSPAAVIAAHVDAGNIDLTVLGSHDISPVFDFVLGTNTERLLQDSKSSVLIVREPRAESP